MDSSDQRASLSRAIVSNFSAQATAAILAFFISPMLVRGLGADRYGAWALVSEILAYYLLLDFGVRGAVGHYVGRYLAQGKQEQVVENLATAFWLLLAVGATAGVAGCGFAYIAPDLFPSEAVGRSEMAVAMSVMALTIGLNLPMETFAAALAGRQRLDLTNLVEIVGQIVGAAAIVFALKSGGLLVAVALAQALGRVVRWVLLYVIANRNIPAFSIAPRNIRRVEARRLIGLGGRKIAIDIARLVLTRTDLLVVGSFLGIKWVAFFSLPRMLIQQISAANSNITRGFTPRLTELYARGESDRVHQAFFLGTAVSAAFSFISTVCVIGYAKYFLRLWVGEEFVTGDLLMRSDTIAVILMVASFPLMIQSTSVQLILASGRLGFLAWLSVLEAVGNLGLSLWLVRDYGLAGVAIGTLIPALVAYLVFLPRYMARQHDFSLRYWFRIAMLRPLAASALVALVISVALSIQEPMTWGALVLQCGIVATLAVPIGLWVGLPADHRRTVLDLRTRLFGNKA